MDYKLKIQKVFEKKPSYVIQQFLLQYPEKNVYDFISSHPSLTTIFSEMKEKERGRLKHLFKAVKKNLEKTGKVDKSAVVDTVEPVILSNNEANELPYEYDALWKEYSRSKLQEKVLTSKANCARAEAIEFSTCVKKIVLKELLENLNFESLKNSNKAIDYIRFLVNIQKDL